MAVEQRDLPQGQEFTVPQGTFAQFVDGWKKRGEGTTHGISHIKLDDETTVSVDGGCGHFHLDHGQIDIQILWRDHSRHVITISQEDVVIKKWKGGIPRDSGRTPPLEVIKAWGRGEPVPEWWKEEASHPLPEHKGPWLSDSMDFPQALDFARIALTTGEAVPTDPRFMCD